VYLSERTGVQVQAKCGHAVELEGGDLDDVQKLKDEEFTDELNEKELQSFKRY
jgi:hypothetical protein